LGLCRSGGLRYREVMEISRWWELVRVELAELAAGGLSGDGRVPDRPPVLDAHGATVALWMIWGTSEAMCAGLVRSEERAVVPLWVGSARAAPTITKHFDVKRAPPGLIVEGRRRTFRAVYGTILIGEIRLARESFLLAIRGERVVVVHAPEGGALRSIAAAPPEELGVIDVDELCQLSGERGGGGEGDSRVRASRGETKRRAKGRGDPDEQREVATNAVAAEHARLLASPSRGQEELATLLRHCFGDLCGRALDPASRRRGEKMLGKMILPEVTDMLCELAVVGTSDLAGKTGELLELFKEWAPPGMREVWAGISARALGNALRLLRATKTCVIERFGHTWRICLRELGDPRSRLHQRLCEETRSECSMPRYHRRRPAVDVAAEAEVATGREARVDEEARVQEEAGIEDGARVEEEAGIEEEARVEEEVTVEAGATVEEAAKVEEAAGIEDGAVEDGARLPEEVTEAMVAKEFETFFPSRLSEGHGRMTVLDALVSRDAQTLIPVVVRRARSLPPAAEVAVLGVIFAIHCPERFRAPQTKDSGENARLDPVVIDEHWGRAETSGSSNNPR
jgi:hypothetical protein